MSTTTPTSPRPLTEREAGAARELARHAELQREWPDDPRFVFDAIVHGWNLDQAKAEYAKREGAK